MLIAQLFALCSFQAPEQEVSTIRCGIENPCALAAHLNASLQVVREQKHVTHTHFGWELKVLSIVLGSRK